MHMSTLLSLLAAAPLAFAVDCIPPTNGTLNKQPPPVHTYTVINSDRGCNRKKQRYETLFRRRGVFDNECFDVSHEASSMRVKDELASEDNQLVCTLYRNKGCDGEAAAVVSFANTTMCVEPRDKHDRKYQSFVCEHSGW